jgi:eukaryotic-like serine/threonine-protein kinase
VTEDGSGGACLDETTVLAFAMGKLSPDRIALAELHLDRCGGCRVAFGEAVTYSRTGQDDQRPLGVVTFGPGDELAGRYRIVRFIARGGMGEVYEAHDQVLGERIALKSVVASAGDDPRAIERLKAEAQLARKVTHPNVCRIFDLVAHEDGFLLTMELLSGETLGARIRRAGRMAPDEVAQLLPQLTAALAAAHAAGVVHRDFKSDNVMLLPPSDGRPARVVVMDFGMARHAP